MNAKKTPASLKASPTQEKHQRIWQVIRQIPKGKVASYGQIAELAGLARSARLVGRVLKSLPQDSRLPWHRVVQSQGTIAFPPGTKGYYRQKKLLKDEGIVFNGKRIKMKEYRWVL